MSLQVGEWVEHWKYGICLLVSASRSFDLYLIRAVSGAENVKMAREEDLRELSILEVLALSESEREDG